MKASLIIGPFSATWYNDMTPKLITKEVRLGYKGYKEEIRIWHYNQDGEKKPIGAVWYTTLDVERESPFVPTATYEHDKYPVYDNYDAINVDKVQDIPYDYDGVMGVPITILEKNLDSVVIEGRGGDIVWAETECGFYTPPTEDKAEEYKAGNETWRIQNPYLLVHDKPVVPYNRVFIKLEGLLYGEYTEIDGEYIKGHRPILNGKQMYSRALIRRKRV